MSNRLPYDWFRDSATSVMARMLLISAVLHVLLIAGVIVWFSRHKAPEPKLISVALVAAPGPMTPTAGSAPPPPPPPPPEQPSPDTTPPPEPEKPKPPEPEKPKPPEPEKPKPDKKGKPTTESDETWKLTYVVTPESAGAISGPPTIPKKKGSAVPVEVTGNEGYTVGSISASDGAKVSGEGPYVLGDVTADTTVTAKLIKGDKKPKKEEEEKADKQLAKKQDDKKKDEDKKKGDKKVKLDLPALDPKDEPAQKTPVKGRPTPKTKGPTLAGSEPTDTTNPSQFDSNQAVSMAVGSGGQGPPVAMGSWPGLFQRQVYLQWVVPNGVPMNDPNYLPQITVTIGRDGKILDGPTVTKPSPSDALNASCVQALVNATLPPFPDNYEEPQIVMVVQFSPQGRQAMGGAAPQPATPGF